MSNSQTSGESMKRGYLTIKNRLEYRKKDAEIYQKIFRNLHRCKKCKYFTRSIFQIQNHVKKHQHEEKKFNCQDSTPEEYFCTECKFSTHLKLYFKLHIREYHCLKKENEETKLVLKTYTCEGCSFWTYSSLVLAEHQTNKKCAPVASTKEKKDQSMVRVIEDGARWYICHHCNYRTDRKSSLTIHILRKHTPSDSILWFKCNECTYKAKMKSGLKEHITLRHRSTKSDKWHNCTQCDYRAQKLNSLKSHISHKHAKLYNCDHCEHTAPFLSDLKLHLFRKHSLNLDVKVYHCDQCDYRTIKPISLKGHKVSKHKTNDPLCLRCDFCNYKTVYPQNLKLHIQGKHSKLGCDKCEYKTKASSALHQHKCNKDTTDRSKILAIDRNKPNAKKRFESYNFDKNTNWLTCSKCQFKCQRIADLAKHFTMHSPVKILKVISAIMNAKRKLSPNIY